jgi:hypothetical protein
MFKVNKTQHVLAVNDLDVSEKYFVEMPGVTLKSRIGGWSFLNLNDFYLMVGHCEGDMLAKDANNHSYFALVNCEGIDDKPWGLREFGVITPEGHRIMFGQEINA